MSDAHSKTIPIWCCVINRTIQLMKRRRGDIDPRGNWDSTLHLPLSVPAHESVQINMRIDGWVKALCDLLGLCNENESSQETSSAWGDLHLVMRKPLRPLWISQSSLIWTDAVSQPEDLPFHPIILVSASAPRVANSMQRMQSPDGPDHSFMYIPGAGDDEESWADGLTPGDLWGDQMSWEMILSLGPSVTAAQIKQANKRDSKEEGLHNLRPIGCSMSSGAKPSEWPDLGSVFRAGQSSSGQAVYLGRLDPFPSGNHLHAAWDRFALILDVGLLPKPWLNNEKRYLWLPIQNHKIDQQSLSRSLPIAMSFLSFHQPSDLPLIIIDDETNGLDSNESVCICLSFLLLSNINKALMVTKQAVRQTLASISSCYPLARPTRSCLRDVYNFLLHFRLEDAYDES